MSFITNSEMIYEIETKSHCEVCGDKARGCNFDAITCASCKEFFRRNAFKQKGLKCYFHDNCTIDVVSRRFCASCRLRKCFSAGMKKEYIMSEEQRNARKVKIIKKRLKSSLRNDSTVEGIDRFMADSDVYKVVDHRMVNRISSQDSSPPSSPSTPSRGLKSPDLPIGTISSNLFGFDEKANISAIVSNDGQSYMKQSLGTDVDAIAKLLNKMKIMRESNYYPTIYALLCRASNTFGQLTIKERHKLRYLTNNIQIMQAETIHELPCNGKFIDLLKITEIKTFMLIKMCKQLTAFQNLSQSDQIALVKGGCMETLILRSVMSINMEKECWETMDLERNYKFCLKMEVLKQVNEKVYEAHRKYALSFQPEWRFDDNIMSLLIAITIFSPERPNLNSVDAIRTEQQCYTNLLKRYLQTIYDETKASTTFDKLMDQLKLTKTISEGHVKAYFDVSTSQIEEAGISRLLMEIFDLNSRNTDTRNDRK